MPGWHKIHNGDNEDWQ